ncbi:hydrogen peroxide-dependent heme synthase [Telmatobacter bradus]|uniref:hydrogen peroxide-dependent heme synthase n=1 Tax=Telmatobacter bradus TaxID=474953 RepID=UPI003B42DF62
MTEFSPVPLTLEGSATLHQFFRFDWKAWKSCTPAERARIVSETAKTLKMLERESEDAPVRSAIFSQLGHKGDLVLVHFRENFEELNQVELDLAQTPLYDYLTLSHSYVSVVELGLYESSRKTWEAAAAKGLEPNTPEFNAEVRSSLERGASAMAPRLYPAIPDAKYLCFYPMDRKRGEDKNWYAVPFAERQRMMHEHGMIGRRYAEVVKQVITGSVGLDDWEWGVTLFAEDPVIFKKIIYEMRFDEVSAVYGLFGQFFLALRLELDKLGDWTEGKL